MENENKLTKFIEDTLPDYFKELTEEDKRKALIKIFDTNTELAKIKSEKLVQSYIASVDLDKLLYIVSEFEQKGKIGYSINSKNKTGSGEINVNIKGGDTKFIVPIIIAIGIVIITILLIIFN